MISATFVYFVFHGCDSLVWNIKIRNTIYMNQCTFCLLPTPFLWRSMAKKLTHDYESQCVSVERMISKLQERKVWCCHCLLTKSEPALCDPMDCNPPGSPVGGILQTRTLEWVAVSFSRGASQPRDRTRISYICIGNRFFTTEPPRNPQIWCDVVTKIETQREPVPVSMPHSLPLKSSYQEALKSAPQCYQRDNLRTVSFSSHS